MSEHAPGPLRRFLASRGFVTLTGAVLAVALAAGAFLVVNPPKRTLAYCAMMPDAIGLYTGSDVTMRGMKVGTVQAIRPEATGVRVEFAIDAAHPLRGRARAATVSDTIVADRALAVLGDKDGQPWDTGSCLTDTATPKSLTQTFGALSRVAKELQGGDDPAHRERVRQAMNALDKATEGTGPTINQLVHDLGSALRSPDAAIGHIGSLIDTVSRLSASIAGNWGQLRDMLDGFSPILQTVNDVWDQVVTIVNSIVTLVPWVNDITTKYGDPILTGLDQSVSYLHLLGANVGSLKQMIELLPVITNLFRSSTDPQTGRVSVSYAPPKVALPQADADQVCSAIDLIAPGRCAHADSGMVAVDLVPLVLGTMGAR